MSMSWSSSCLTFLWHGEDYHQHSIVTYLRYDGNFYTFYWEFHLFFHHWKNFENRLTFDKVISQIQHHFISETCIITHLIRVVIKDRSVVVDVSHWNIHQNRSRLGRVTAIQCNHCNLISVTLQTDSSFCFSLTFSLSRTFRNPTEKNVKNLNETVVQGPQFNHWVNLMEFIQVYKIYNNSIYKNILPILGILDNYGYY